MWKVNMKIWIATIIFSTVSCKVATYDDIVTAPPYHIEIQHHSAPCTSCGSDPSISIPPQTNPYDNSLDYLQNVQGTQQEILLTQIGDEDERSNAIDPPSGKCRPELHLHVFGDHTDTSVAYTPKCTRVRRCNGCCNSNLRSCYPTNKTMTNFKVIKRTISRGNMSPNQVILSVEEHLSCECQCIIKRDSCTVKQEYDADNCRCDCRNIQDRIACLKNNVVKRWDLDTCSCVCRSIELCHEGFGFDTDTCRCKEGFIPENLREPNVLERQQDFMNRYIYRPFNSIETQQRRHKDEP